VVSQWTTIIRSSRILRWLVCANCTMSLIHQIFKSFLIFFLLLRNYLTVCSQLLYHRFSRCHLLTHKLMLCTWNWLNCSTWWPISIYFLSGLPNLFLRSLFHLLNSRSSVQPLPQHLFCPYKLIYFNFHIHVLHLDQVKILSQRT
jgi:hypothetical protein